MELYPRRRKPGAARREQLSERCDARIEARAHDDRPHADERACLHRIRDTHGAMAEERIHISANVRAQRVGVVDVEGRPIAVGELHEIRATDREMAIATDDRFLRPDRAIDLYELCGARPVETR